MLEYRNRHDDVFLRVVAPSLFGLEATVPTKSPRLGESNSATNNRGQTTIVGREFFKEEISRMLSRRVTPLTTGRPFKVD